MDNRIQSTHIDVSCNLAKLIKFVNTLILSARVALSEADLK